MSLQQLLRDSLIGLGRLPEERQMQWAAPDEDVELLGDAARLRPALTHLLRNALSFSSPPVRVNVTARQDESQTVIIVQDDGPGIAPEFHERVFELFQRLGLPGQGGGNGVGLTLARKIAELHGGSLTLASAPGQGTTLTLTLPSGTL